MKGAIGLIVLAGCAIAGCGGDDDELRDAGQARTAEASATASAAQSDAVAIGTRVELNNGMAVTLVKAIEDADLSGRKPSPPHASWVTLTVAIENTSGSEQPLPDFALVCPDGSQGARYTDDSADSISGLPLPSKSKDEGTILMGVPSNCAGAAVTAKATGLITGTQRVASWKLP